MAQALLAACLELVPGPTMKPGGLLLILGSFALWAELSAAPTKDSAGSSPLPQLGGTGTHQPGEIPSTDEGSRLPSAVKKDARVLQTDPVPGGDPLPSERPACKKGLGNKTEAGSAGKPLCGEKPVCAGKLAPAGAHLAHLSPTSDGKLTSGCDEPTSGGMASSDSGHATPGKPPQAGKPAPHNQPGSSEKPAAEKPQAEEEPEEDAGDGDGDGSEEEEEGDDDDNDEDEEEGDRYEGLSSIFSEDNDEGKEDTFDHELDYGLDQSPLNSDEYHDWWGGGEAEELEARPKGEGEEEGGGADAFEEPVFDVWGDPVEKGSRPEARSGGGRF
ncbi:PREDICTED: acidic leucine-rich nuclear phosphoprotein 32-related protein 2-like [Gekko japonicus]|uniref:Acidic leucine-rich nuclear phosphoprotein 32-related protein 2-like n=1 Tax=Gekko japonicus TaxID=146911 RepID=A0ABM1JPE6_GEKJA|nr:PREDICTED: acidic leucine-rich nuclear phosphoprotein 32-related protein 2-like [Gekko japonicus]